MRKVIEMLDTVYLALNQKVLKKNRTIYTRHNCQSLQWIWNTMLSSKDEIKLLKPIRTQLMQTYPNLETGLRRVLCRKLTKKFERI